MSPNDPVSQMASPSNPPPVRGDPTVFVVPRWMFFATWILLSAGGTAVLIFVDLATKKDLEQLAQQEDVEALEAHLEQLAQQEDVEALEAKVEEIEGSTRVSGAAAAAHARCVSKGLENMQEFSKELALWIRNQSRVDVSLFSVYEEAPEKIRNYFDQLRDGLHSIHVESKNPGARVQADSFLDQHVRGLLYLASLTESLDKIDSQECVDLLIVSTTTTTRDP